MANHPPSPTLYPAVHPASKAKDLDLTSLSEENDPVANFPACLGLQTTLCNSFDRRKNKMITETRREDLLPGVLAKKTSSLKYHVTSSGNSTGREERKVNERAVYRGTENAMFPVAGNRDRDEAGGICKDQVKMI